MFANRLKDAWSDCRGQVSVEYLIVGLILIAVIIGLGALLGRIEEGLIIRHAIESASHAFGSNTAGSIGDVLIY
ncbi:MAG: hypothetical protein LBH87_02450 [Coriobacteriales bacterium]|nr:hypothetical protein [Coriobacteriales bacterium]